MSDYAIGIDLGGTNFKAVSVTPDGHIIEQRSYATDDVATGGAGRWAQRISGQIQQLESNRGKPARWVGLASPGLASADGRSIAWMQGRLEAVQGLDWTAQLQRKTPVPVLNDAHAALLGEVWLGAAAGAANAVLLTLGTGVGGAILCDGRLLRGHLGRAGHLGHISLDVEGGRDIVGTPGSLEDMVGNCTIERRSGGRYRSVRQLVDEYQAGDPFAVRLWLQSVHALACGIVSIINAVDPEFVILGGGIAQSGPALLEPLENFVRHYEWQPTGQPVRIVLARLGEYAGALGAARQAINEMP